MSDFVSHLSDYDVIKKTVYAEARNQSLEGQQAVVWVMKNRANRPRNYWGGPSLRSVCLAPLQFECWNDKLDIEIREPKAYASIDRWLKSVIDAPMDKDPTYRCDHYNNPEKEKGNKKPKWVDNVTLIMTIGDHAFYKE